MASVVQADIYKFGFFVVILYFSFSIGFSYGAWRAMNLLLTAILNVVFHFEDSANLKLSELNKTIIIVHLTKINYLLWTKSFKQIIQKEM